MVLSLAGLLLVGALLLAIALRTGHRGPRS
jgi:hypothetical protein